MNQRSFPGPSVRTLPAREKSNKGARGTTRIHCPVLPPPPGPAPPAQAGVALSHLVSLASCISRTCWQIADRLGCPIDLAVGREDIDAAEPEVFRSRLVGEAGPLLADVRVQYLMDAERAEGIDPKIFRTAFWDGLFNYCSAVRTLWKRTRISRIGMRTPAGISRSACWAFEVPTPSRTTCVGTLGLARASGLRTSRCTSGFRSGRPRLTNSLARTGERLSGTTQTRSPESCS